MWDLRPNASRQRRTGVDHPVRDDSAGPHSRTGARNTYANNSPLHDIAQPGPLKGP